MSKPDWKSAMIVFDDVPESGEKDLYSQEAATVKQREELVKHLETVDAVGEVELAPATPLPSVLVEGSERGLAECLKAPSVKEVLPFDGDLPMQAL